MSSGSGDGHDRPPRPGSGEITLPGMGPGPEPLSEWRAEEAEMLRGLFLEEATEHLRLIVAAGQALGRAAEGASIVSPELVDGLFRPLHTLKGTAGSVGFQAIANLAHEIEELCADMRAGTLAPTPGILERVDEGVAGLRALLEGARSAPARTRTPSSIPAVPEAVPTEISGDLSGERRRLERRLVGERRGGTDRTVRVEAERLDALLDGVGDLVIQRTRIERRLRELEGVLRDLVTTRGSLRGILRAFGARALPGASPPAAAPGATDDDGAEAMLDQMAELDIELTDAVGNLDRSTRSLTDETESLRRITDAADHQLQRARRIPVEFLYHRLASGLRELERSGNRRAEIITHGGDIEIDKSVIDQIADPLLHLLRNSIAHGIEPAVERVSRGKPPKGRIEISAKQDGEVVLLRFEDDGRGIDLEQIKSAMIRTGRLDARAEVNEKTLLDTIFEPGFSSRSTSDALAGRGMGLNIVKKSLLRLGGDVTVEYRRGAFTRFLLKVPLVASITQALLFKVGGQVYAVPTVNVVEALPLGPDNLMVKDGVVEGVKLAGVREGVPILRLQSLLGVELPPGRRAAALHVRFGERAFIMTCDKIIGPRTIVVRPLGPLLAALPLYAGVTVSGAGKAQLVLDLGALADAAHAPARASDKLGRRGLPRILVVDDSRLSRETVARVLAGAGYHPVTAEDGWDAWELLAERRFDAVVTDLEMPRVDGFELATRIRREPTLRGLPIVVLSSRTARTTRERAREAGANVVLAKGPNKRALLDALAALLASDRAPERQAGG